MLVPSRLPVIICGLLLYDRDAWLTKDPQASIVRVHHAPPDRYS